jgi:ferredoxin
MKIGKTVSEMISNNDDTKKIKEIMPIKKVWIEEGCTTCGLCEDICPEVFKLEDMTTVI